MLRSTIHLTTCRGRRILVIYYVKYIIGNTCPLPEDAFQAYPAEASPDRLNFDFSSFFDHKFTTFTTNLTLLYNTRQND